MTSCFTPEQGLLLGQLPSSMCPLSLLVPAIQMEMQCINENSDEAGTL
jgi:hypothetical protein